MAGPVACVYLTTQSPEATLDRLHVLLQERATCLQPTRKGRVWDAWFGGSQETPAVPMRISVESTCDGIAQIEAEDDLLATGLLPADFPLRILLSAGCNGPDDWSAVRKLSEEIAEVFSGVAIEPVK